MKELYIGYGHGQGAFCAKASARRDLRVLSSGGGSGLRGARSLLAVLKRDRSLAIPPWLMLKGLPPGMRWGWRRFAPGTPDPRP